MSIGIKFQNSDEVIFADEARFHTLRHFSSVDEPFRNEIKKIKSDEAIDNQLLMAGGKFLPSFCNNPDALWSILRAYMLENKSEIFWNDSKGYCNLHFDLKRWPSGIGTDGIVKVISLKKEDRQWLHMEDRGGFNMLCFTQEVSIPTWQVNIIFQKVESKICITTIFPGTFAPAFPNKLAQSEEEFRSSSLFWSEFALIRNARTL